MVKEDQRVVLTKRLLKESLLKCLKTKDINRINVTELCRDSAINRATFYRHYKQPRDILSEIKRDIILDIRELGKKNYLKGSIKRWIEDTCEYFYQNRELFIILFNCRSDEEFVSLINEAYNIQLHDLKNIGLPKDVDEDALKLGTYYYSGGIYYILRQWLIEPINKTPLEISELIFNLLYIKQ